MWMIVAACVFGGFLSMLIAAVFAFRLSQTWLYRMVAYSAGVMLASAFLDVLPEAFEAMPDKLSSLFALLLAGVMGFFVLERLAIWRHSHPDDDDDADGIKHGDDHHHAHHHHHHASPTIVPAVLLGDTFHHFVDGILMAAAYMADPWVGVAVTLAVFAHEIPHEMGDFALLLSAGWTRKRALIANIGSSFAAVFGGVAGYFALESSRQYVPYVLTIAAASFIYIAVADLMPMLHRRHHQDGFFWQISMIILGIASVALIGHFLH